MTHLTRPVHALSVVLLSLVAFTLMGCLPPAMTWLAKEMGYDDEGQPGSDSRTLLVTFEDNLSRTLVPAVDMTAASYVITGRGPSGSNFVRTTTGASAEIRDLQVGLWDVTVEARNAAGKVIGSGTTQVTLRAGTPATASVQIKPLAGYGTLQLTVSWPAAQVAAATVVAQLVPATGAARSLTFVVGSGTASSTTADIPTGYHTLSLQVLDGGVPVAGAVEIVRIIKGETTAGTVAFTQINPATVTVQVTITPQLNDPLTVSLSGQMASVVQGTGFTVQASVAAAAGSVVYTWYLNGALRSTGASFAVPTDLLPGSYRIDVTALSADGLRAGSTNHSFTVTASPTTTQVTLAWDPAVGPDIAGYKLHYGTASGVYDHVVDARTATSYTVTGLQRGVTYYFAATAYNSAGTESSYSNEVRFDA